MKKLDHITIDPSVCLGQPAICGIWMTVSVVLKMLAAGKSVSDVPEAYPELEPEEMQQVIMYAARVMSGQVQMVSA